MSFVFVDVCTVSYCTSRCTCVGVLCVVCCVLFFVLPETEVDFLFIFLSSAFHIEIARSAVPFQAFTTSKKTYSHEKFVGDINNRVACYYAYTQPGHGKKNTYCGSFFCTGEIEFLILVRKKGAEGGWV